MHFLTAACVSFVKQSKDELSKVLKLDDGTESSMA